MSDDRKGGVQEMGFQTLSLFENILENIWKFLKRWVLYCAVNNERKGTAGLFVCTILCALAILIGLRSGPLGAILSILFWIPATLFCATFWVGTVVAPWVRDFQLWRTQQWLTGPAHHSRQIQEQEAAKILASWKGAPTSNIGTYLKGTIFWRLAGVDRSSGLRLLVQPLFDQRMCVLVGEDPRSKRPFFLSVPPTVSTVEEALEWLWKLPAGLWNKYEVYET